MDYKYIEQLLDRYFLCETSLEEESILRTFFEQSDVPASLLPYKDLFVAQRMGDERLSDDFEERILAEISKDASTDVQNGEGAPVVKVKTISLSYKLRPFFRAAAVVAIILSFSLAVQQAMYNSQEQNGTVYSSSLSIVPTQSATAMEQQGIVARPDSLAQLSSEVQTAPELVPER